MKHIKNDTNTDIRSDIIDLKSANTLKTPYNPPIAEENNILGFCDQLLELINLVFADAAESVNSRFQNNTSINEHLLCRRRQGQHLRDRRDRGTFRLRRTFPYR